MVGKIEYIYETKIDSAGGKCKLSFGVFEGPPAIIELRNTIPFLTKRFSPSEWNQPPDFFSEGKPRMR